MLLPAVFDAGNLHIMGIPPPHPPLTEFNFSPDSPIWQL